jgi:2-haloacid dehalogenase
VTPEDTVLAFDVNETLLDLRALDPMFEAAFGDAAARGLWFAQMLQLSFTGTITDRYVDFTTAQRAALVMLAARLGVEVGQETIDAIVGAMSSLPPHEEVVHALARLHRAGWRVAALTNSPLQVVEAQLFNAGVRSRFELVMSADEVRRLKPAPEPYRELARRCRVDFSSVCLVAAHAWDVSGALAAGCRAAFVARPGMVASPIEPRPDVHVRDIADLARALGA